MWRRLLLAGGYTVAGVLVLVAVASSIIRVNPSLHQNYLPAIQQSISSIVGKPVQIRMIRIDWNGYVPLVTVHGLSVYSDDTRQKQLLYAEKAFVSIDPYRSLMDREFAIRELQLTGGNLEVLRTGDKRIILNGIDISDQVATRTNSDTARDIRISLSGSTVAIKDEILNLEYFLERADIMLIFHEGKLRVASKFLLPDSLGNALVLAFDVENLDQELKSIKGAVYAKGENVNLELLGNVFPMLQVGVRGGRSDFEVWGSLKSAQETLLHGRLVVRDLEYRDLENQVGEVGQEVIALDTRFKMQGSGDSWHLALIDSDIRTANRKWAGENYEIKCIQCNSEAFTVSAALEYVNLVDLLATLQHFPVFSGHLQRIWPDVQIRGELSNVQLLTRWHDKQVAKYAYKASLQNIAVSAPVYAFEASSLSGEVVGNHLQGRFSLDSPAAKIHVHHVADDAFPDHKITGQIKWKILDHSFVAGLENISLVADGMHANLQGIVQLGHEKSYADLQAEIPQARIAALKSWLPYKKMNQKLVHWFREAVKDGVLSHARLLFNGDPGRFSFGGETERFEVYAGIEDASLDYRKSWPGIRNASASLEIRDKQLNVQGSMGEILNSDFHSFTASIDDIRLPRLVIHSNSSGPANDILAFLKQSTLIPLDSQIPRHISVAGDVGLDLNIVMTLTRKLEKERHVDGTIEFRGTDLTVTQLSLPFTNVNGKLNFSRQGVEGKGLRAELYGSTFGIEAELLENGRTGLQIGGDFDIDSWMAANHFQAAEYIRGKALLSATVSLPQLAKHDADGSLEINIDSDLTGTSFTLPEPLNKDSGVPSALNIHTRYQSGVTHPLVARFEDRIFVQAQLDPDSKQISALEVRTGNGQFDSLQEGVTVSGNFDRLDMTGWLDTFKSNTGMDSLALQAVDIQANEISVFGIAFREARFILEKDVQAWSGRIRSQTFSGEFHYPQTPESDRIVTARLDHFRFDKPEEEVSISVDPRNLPALDVHVRRFELGDLPVNNVILKTEPSPQGMIIDSMSGEGNSLEIVASGAWNVDANSVQSTELDIVLVTQDLRDSLEGLGFETEMKKGEGIISSKIHWPGAPYQFSLDSFAGTANLRLKDGEIVSVEPGAGRLIGLLNISVISRRLSLDFSDFFSEGYVFDKIRGNLAFRDGNLTTEDLRIKGPNANIGIEGRTGIVDKDYDQLITVTPHVSGGLPWLGIPMGPAGVGGIYVLGKIAEKIGIDVDKAIDKVVEVKYHMTGSWDDPKIEPVAQKAAETEPSLQSPASGSSGEESATASP